MIKVPRGVVVVEGEAAPDQPERVNRSACSRTTPSCPARNIENPEAGTRPQHQRAHRDHGVHGGGARGLRAGHQADRRARARALRPPGTQPPSPRAPSSASRSRWTTRSSRSLRSTSSRTRGDRRPHGRPDPERIGYLEERQDLAESLRIGALPIDLKLISETQVSATLGAAGAGPGPHRGSVGLALTLVFLLLFYRVLGAVATVALLIYAALLFALVKLIPITLTLPGIAGMMLTLAVAADANIVIFERIKEEVRRAGVRAGRSPRATPRRCGRSSTRTS